MSKRFTNRTEVELERRKAELTKLRNEIGGTATAMIFRKRPWDEVQADLIKLWGEKKLPVTIDEE